MHLRANTLKHGRSRNVEPFLPAKFGHLFFSERALSADTASSPSLSSFKLVLKSAQSTVSASVGGTSGNTTEETHWSPCGGLLGLTLVQLQGPLSQPIGREYIISYGLSMIIAILCKEFWIVCIASEHLKWPSFVLRCLLCKPLFGWRVGEQNIFNVVWICKLVVTERPWVNEQ